MQGWRLCQLKANNTGSDCRKATVRSAYVFKQNGVCSQSPLTELHFWCHHDYGIQCRLSCLQQNPHYVVIHVRDPKSNVRSCIWENKLTLILLTWRKWWAPNNASRWQMGFNSAFKGLWGVYNFNICVTVHCWYNNINSQLDATITNFIDNYNQLNMFRAYLAHPQEH